VLRSCSLVGGQLALGDKSRTVQLTAKETSDITTDGGMFFKELVESRGVDCRGLDLYAQKDPTGGTEVIIKRQGLPAPTASDWPSAEVRDTRTRTQRVLGWFGVHMR
jgi:hypothetical protein